MKYGIVGSGPADPAVVQEGLIDIRSSDPQAIFHIHARRAPQGAVGSVYDYLIDNEVPFVAHTRIDDNAPKMLLDSAVEVIKSDDPMASILEASDKALILWDEANTEGSESIAIWATDAGVPVLDLSMALTPVVIEGSPEVTETSPETPADEVSPFSRAELESMTIAVLRRQAKSLGIEEPKTTKSEIIDQILGEESIPQKSMTIQVDETPNNTDSDTAVVIWYENDRMQVIQVKISSIKKLLG
jgi:hypothetical protein